MSITPMTDMRRMNWGAVAYLTFCLPGLLFMLGIMAYPALQYCGILQIEFWAWMRCVGFGSAFAVVPTFFGSTLYIRFKYS